MKTKSRIWITITISILVLAALSVLIVRANNQAPTFMNVWIDTPLDGMTIPLAPYDVVSHASSPTGIASFELSVNGQAYRQDDTPADQKGQTLVVIYQEWEPPAPGTYQLSVRAADTNGAFGLPTQVEVQVGEILESQEEEYAATEPRTEDDEIIAVETCTWTAKINVFCRSGPSSKFPDTDDFVAGQSAPVVAQTTDGYFLFVLGVNTGKECTVPSNPKYGSMSGDCDAAARYTPEPTPGEPPTEAPPTGCTVQDRSGLITCEVPCPPRAIPGNPCTP